jgi:hypothetical protein
MRQDIAFNVFIYSFIYVSATQYGKGWHDGGYGALFGFPGVLAPLGLGIGIGGFGYGFADMKKPELEMLIEIKQFANFSGPVKYVIVFTENAYPTNDLPCPTGPVMTG